MAANRSGYPQPFNDQHFDLFDWYPKFQSCARYFLDHAQYELPVQAVAALLNIQLPFQRSEPIYSFNMPAKPPSPLVGAPSPRSMPGQHQAQMPSYATLIPYIRRLVATGFDASPVLHGFFGDDWVAGIGQLHQAERRNYMFAAKSDTWLVVKSNYDMADGQFIPFLKPLSYTNEKEIQIAESNWSEWLAMQDWMLGPRHPIQIKTEDD